VAELFFSQAQLEEIWKHLDACRPQEGCGLVGGREGRAALVLPVENLLHSPVRFQMEPIAQLRAMETIDRAGLELAAVYHSHPAGPAHPSATDLAEFYYPEALALIVSPRALAAPEVESSAGLTGNYWIVRGFLLKEQTYIEVKLDRLEEK
jgi:proteasome lid subunit RPN8/RPN11